MYVPNSWYTLNNHVCLITRVYGMKILMIHITNCIYKLGEVQGESPTITCHSTLTQLSLFIKTHGRVSWGQVRVRETLCVIYSNQLLAVYNTKTTGPILIKITS